MKELKKILFFNLTFFFLNVAMANKELELTRSYLKTCQTIEGGWGYGYDRPSLSVTAKALLAIRLTGEVPKEWRVNGKSVVDFLKWVKEQDQESYKKYYAFYVFSSYLTGSTEELGVNAKDINEYINSEVFGVSGNTFEANWLLLSSKFDREIDKAKLAQSLLKRQRKDGGWAYRDNPALKSDIDSTAMVVMSVPREFWSYEGLKKAYDFLSSKEIQNPFAVSKKTNLPQMNLLYLSRLHLESLDSVRFPYGEKEDHVIKLKTYQRENGSFLLTEGVAHNPCSSAVYGLLFLTGKSFAQVADVEAREVKRDDIKSLIASTETSPKVSVRIEGPSGFSLVDTIEVAPMSYINPFNDKPIHETRPTALLAVMGVLKKHGVSFTIHNLYGTVLTDIDGHTGYRWNYKINNQNAEICVSDLSLKSGDEVLYYSGEYDSIALKIRKKNFRRISVVNLSNETPVEGAEIFIDGISVGFTDKKGEREVPLSLIKSLKIVAEKNESVRSEVFLWNQRMWVVIVGALIFILFIGLCFARKISKR